MNLRRLKKWSKTEEYPQKWWHGLTYGKKWLEFRHHQKEGGNSLRAKKRLGQVLAKAFLKPRKNGLRSFPANQQQAESRQTSAHDQKRRGLRHCRSAMRHAAIGTGAIGGLKNRAIIGRADRKRYFRNRNAVRRVGVEEPKNI